MRILMVFCLLVFSIFAFGQRKKIEIKYEIRTDGKRYGRRLGLNFYGDTINRIPVKFISFKDLQAFRNYEFDTIPERCDWKHYSVMLKINQKSKNIPYIKAQGELGENIGDTGVRISTNSRVFNSSAFVYTDMTLLGYEYSKRIASNVKIFDAKGDLIREVTDTTQTMYEHIEMDEDAKFISCVTYTGPNEYGDIQGETKESSSTVSIYVFPEMKLIWKWNRCHYGVNYYKGFFYWVNTLKDNEEELIVFDSKNNSAYRLLYDPEKLQFNFSENVNGFLKNFDGYSFIQKADVKNVSKYFNRDFERLK